MFKSWYDLKYDGLTTFVVLYFIVLAIWAVKFGLGLWFHYLYKHGRIQQYPARERRVTSVVTYAGEQYPYFKQCIETLRAQEGLAEHRIYVVLDDMEDVDANDELCRALALENADGVIETNVKRKRDGLDEGMCFAEECDQLHEIVVLVDSDTVSTDTRVLFNLVQPFDDPKIGGTSTYQRGLLHNTSSERVGDVLEHARANSSMAACSLVQQVPCLPGRMIALRTAVVKPHMKALRERHWEGYYPALHSRFPFILKWGRVKLKAGDDRELTDVLLKAGYGTVFVSKAKVHTLLGETWGKSFRQWIRWGTTSQGYVLRSLDWLPRKAPAAFLNHDSDILISHIAVYMFWSCVYSILWGEDELYLPLGAILLGTITFLFFSFAARNSLHYWERPLDLRDLPVFILAITVGVHIRVVTLWTWWIAGKWGTRPGVDTVSKVVFYKRIKTPT